MSVAIETVLLDINAIRTDGGTQIRAGMNQSRVEELAELLLEGYPFADPIKVVYDGTDYWPEDGFHRIAGTKLAGLATIEAKVRSGTREDAIEGACGANATHGLPRNNQDKRNAVERLLDLPKWQQNKSNREIAKQCGVTEHLVRNVRNDLPENHPAATKSQKPINQPVERGEEGSWPRNLRVTNKDKQETIEEYFANTPEEEWDTNVTIAKNCGVTEGTVRNFKRKLLEERQQAEQKQIEETARQLELKKITEKIETAPNPEVLEAEPIGVEPETTPSGFTYAYCVNCDEILDDWEPVENGWACGNCGDITLINDMQIRESRNRYDGSKPATCKYCYKTHNQWESAEEGWECRKCGYVTSDECMEIEDVEPSKTQIAFYQKHSDNTITEQEEQEQPQIETEPIDEPEVVPGPEELDLLLPQEEIEKEPLEVARNAPLIEQGIDQLQVEIVEQQGLLLAIDQSNKLIDTSLLPNKEGQTALEEDIAKEKNDEHVMRVMGSSDSPEWYTPQEIIDLACQMFGTIDTDPCSNSHETPAVPAHTLYTKDDDGLSKKWTGKTYLNPPYGAEISKWTDKLVTEYKSGNVTEALALLPARIDTVWFSPLYEYVMCNVKGRIQFANSPYHAPFPCVIVYLGTHLNDFIEVFKNLGPIMRRIA